MAEQREVHTVKMAKASKKEWKAILDFFQTLEVMIDDTKVSTDDLWEYIYDQMQGDVGAGYNRVLWGFDTLVENVCDPTLDYLEWKPELRDMNEQRDEARQYARRFYLRYLNELANFDTAWRRVMDAERERDEARKRTEFLEAVNDLSLDTTNRAQDLAGRLLKFAGRLIDERDATRAHLRQLLHALDSMEGADLSYNVRAQMRQARRLLKEGDGDEA